MCLPVFAVVGHPNKGKSSIVATLARDDSVLVAPDPGTTTKSRSYPLRIDGQLLYTLVDTPGFQRPRRALAWMKQHATSVVKRPQVVRAFVQTHQPRGEFPDECELLHPLIEGAGILYVIDGSRPYGQEYEAEMEILRWTGQPSMALINPIADESHVEEWTVALGQYFKVVRVFDAVTAEFDKRLELLRAFGQLQQRWSAALDRAVASLEADRARRYTRSARAIAELLVDMMTTNVIKKLPARTDPAPHRDALAKAFQDRLRKRERAGRQTIERIYGHYQIKRSESAMDLIDQDLFSQQSWLLWGLSRRQLLATGVASGAVIGGGLDVSVGGTSFLFGTVVGAAVGGASAWLSYNRIINVKVLGLPLGGVELRAGPIGNKNFPYVVVGRALYHHRLVSGRTHAQREDLSVDHSASIGGSSAFSDAQRLDLERCFTKLRRSRDEQTTSRECEKLAEWLNREGFDPADRSS